MHTNLCPETPGNRVVSCTLVVQPFDRYLTSAPRRVRDGEPGARCGQHLARLIARDIRVVQRFDDHAWVIGRLWDSGEVETLFRVAASGLLHGLARDLYRLAIETWLRQWSGPDGCGNA